MASKMTSRMAPRMASQMATRMTSQNVFQITFLFAPLIGSLMAFSIAFYCVFFVFCLAKLTMSARAFPITLCPSSVRLSGRPSSRPSVRPLDYFSKPISYSFGRIASKLNTGIKYDVTNLA